MNRKKSSREVAQNNIDVCHVKVLSFFCIKAFFFFRVLGDVKIKNHASMQNWARRHYLVFVVFYCVSPILTFEIKVESCFLLTKELENNYILSHDAECSLGNIFLYFSTYFPHLKPFQIIAKFEKKGKYTPLLHGGTCNKYFLVECLLKSNLFSIT